MRREKKSSEEEAPKGRFHSELFDWGEALILSLTIVILVFVFGVRIIGVEGSSMVPTLQNGNQLLVSNLFYTPEKGDIVILTKDSFMTSPIVKRVIATEGDTVDIDFETGEVSVNGWMRRISRRKRRRILTWISRRPCRKDAFSSWEITAIIQRTAAVRRWAWWTRAMSSARC